MKFEIDSVASPSTFESLDIKVLDFATEETSGGKDYKEFEVSYRNTPLTLSVEQEATFSAMSGDSEIRLTIALTNGTDHAFTKITVKKKKDGTYSVETDVTNDIRKMPGLGRGLWEMALPVIQKMADQWNSPLQHEVKKVPYKKLSLEKWDTLFLPLLEKHGYTPHGEAWTKTYSPKK